jgi:hypothetical protein
MISKEMIQKKLERLNEEQLKKINDVIEDLSDSDILSKKASLMSKLQQISIDAPHDFSRQIGVNLGRDVDEG